MASISAQSPTIKRESNPLIGRYGPVAANIIRPHLFNIIGNWKCCRFLRLSLLARRRPRIVPMIAMNGIRLLWCIVVLNLMGVGRQHNFKLTPTHSLPTRSNFSITIWPFDILNLFFHPSLWTIFS
jgi:hypothetical protein